MATALIVLIAVALLVWLSIARPNPFSSTTPSDRDRERQVGELRAMSGSRADVRIP
jgi:hypothetical protein